MTRTGFGVFKTLFSAEEKSGNCDASEKAYCNSLVRLI